MAGFYDKSMDKKNTTIYQVYDSFCQRYRGYFFTPCGLYRRQEAHELGKVFLKSAILDEVLTRRQIPDPGCINNLDERIVSSLEKIAQIETEGLSEKGKEKARKYELNADLVKIGGIIGGLAGAGAFATFMMNSVGFSGMIDHYHGGVWNIAYKCGFTGIFGTIGAMVGSLVGLAGLPSAYMWIDKSNNGPRTKAEKQLQSDIETKCEVIDQEVEKKKQEVLDSIWPGFKPGLDNA